MERKKHLCLKEHWGMFILVLVTLVLCGFVTYKANINKNEMEMYIGYALCILCIIVDLILLNMNLRRKRIQKEFIGEFEKDIRKKEVMCPKCGTLMGASGICPQCGYKR